MRNNKRYTNATFTRRVNHEAGRHCTLRAPAEPRVCAVCGSVYARRRWTAAPDFDAGRHSLERATVVICPACLQAGGVPAGFVLVSGAFFNAHRDELERLLRNEAARAACDNPLARIMAMDRSGGQLIVQTTTEHLAQRLGHALEKAFDGRVRYDFSHENKLARVFWSRS